MQMGGFYLDPPGSKETTHSHRRKAYIVRTNWSKGKLSVGDAVALSLHRSPFPSFSLSLRKHHHSIYSSSPVICKDVNTLTASAIISDQWQTLIYSLLYT